MTFNHGLILGKFYPPHLGHLHLIQEGKKKCNHLTVIIASLANEIIPGWLRLDWLNKLVMDPDIEIIWIEDENPQYPEEHPDFWQIWKKSIERVLTSPIDILFTSEVYGETLSRILGTKHLSIDKERIQFPISATKIRTKPLDHWDYIPDLIKPFFLKKIVLTGPESVGKSTLTSILAEHFQTTFVPEYAREYLEKKGRSVIEDDILSIGKGHLLDEIEKSIKANRYLFLDTDHLTTKIYSEFYFKNSPEWVNERAKNLSYDHSLFLNIDVPWISDPQRDLENYREEMKFIFQNEMISAGRPFTLLSGNFMEREKLAIETVKEIGKLPINPDYFTSEQIHLRNV